MRACRDRALPEDYRAWVDPTRPLPEDVHLLPRQVKVGDDLLLALGVGGLFAVMGAFMGALLARAARAGDPWGILLLAAVTAGLWLVPLVLARRLIGTIRASKEAKDGRLRQGLLLGPQGLLLRLTPNHGYVVSAKEFMVAKMRTSPRGQRQRFFRIETRDDAVEFFAERLRGEPDDVNGHSQRVWGRKRPKAP